MHSMVVLVGLLFRIVLLVAVAVAVAVTVAVTVAGALRLRDDR
ncbi:hypothetical protein ACFOWE_32715 [Planomonospora corallina]|uniref:Uncharacterized protein n=1 Tax=Planomonospora corallina TaxID=1806052 RepID=A0ABV8IG34_9ACTN